MSVEAASARVAQILAMQQQLATGSLGSAAAPAAAAPGSIPSSSAGSSDFATVLAGVQSGSPARAADLAGASGSTGQQVTAMRQMAEALVGKPYVWGGGHGGWDPTSGYDCSGFVSAVLHAGGYLSQPADTTTLPNQPGILTGPGQRVTIYDRAQPGENGHVIIDIDGQFYESGGSAGAWGGGGGVERIGTPSAAYLATFPNVLHPSGL